MRTLREILMIVGGVLIALLVNDWNERRKQSVVFEETLTRVYTDVQKERFQARRDFEDSRLQWSLMQKILKEPDAIPDDVLPFALFYLDLPGNDYVLSPAAAALREQVNLLMPNANTPREMQVVKDVADYTAWTASRQDLRWVEVTAGTGPAPLRPLLLEAGLRDPALLWGYSALNGFANARRTFTFTPEEKARARKLIGDPRFLSRLQGLEARKTNLYFGDTRTFTVDALARKIREAYPGIQMLFTDVSIVGSAISKGTDEEVWSRSVRMDRVAEAGSRWTLDLSLTDGFVKFRTGDAWDENWGGRAFPEGQLLWFGDDIRIPAAGRYRVTVDIEAETYASVRLGD